MYIASYFYNSLSARGRLPFLMRLRRFHTLYPANVMWLGSSPWFLSAVQEGTKTAMTIFLVIYNATLVCLAPRHALMIFTCRAAMLAGFRCDVREVPIVSSASILTVC